MISTWLLRPRTSRTPQRAIAQRISALALNGTARLARPCPLSEARQAGNHLNVLSISADDPIADGGCRSTCSEVGGDEDLRIRNQVGIVPKPLEHKIHEASDAHRQVLAVRVPNEQMRRLRNTVGQQGYQRGRSKEWEDQRKRRKHQPVSVHGRRNERGDAIRQKLPETGSEALFGPNNQLPDRASVVLPCSRRQLWRTRSAGFRGMPCFPRY